MKKLFSTLLLTIILFSTACGSSTADASRQTSPKGSSATVLPAEPVKGKPEPDENADLDPIIDSYYMVQNTPVFDYLQHSSIKRFLTMWVEENTGISDPEWDYDSIAQYHSLGGDMESTARDDNMYSCNFSDGMGRYGYIVISYDENGPSVSNMGVTETTPRIYDLKTNIDAITLSLMKTDIDLSTAAASRVSLAYTENNRADQAIRFSDGKGDNYICYLDSPDFAVEKL